jgi:hypothetical protein
MQMCSQIPIEMTAQFLPGLPPTAKFVVTEPARVPPELGSKKPLHPDLEGFFVTTDENAFRGVEDFLTKNCKSKRAVQDAMVEEIYGDLLSIQLKTMVERHGHLRKKWSRSWIDSSLSVRRLDGTVTACYKPYTSSSRKRDSSELRFVVDFDESSLRNANEGLEMFGLNNTPKSMEMSLCDTELGLLDSPGSTSNPRRERWIIPYEVTDQVDAFGRPFRTIKLKVNEIDNVLTLRVQESTIAGAGLGAIITSSAELVLEKNVYVDVGVYAPLRLQDLKPEPAENVKSVVKGPMCEDFSFDHMRELVFDITDDCTGELSDKARLSVLTYVNEISGASEDSSVNCKVGVDPTGAIHFLVGNPDGLSLDSREKELKTDYGTTYEKSRVRNNYPRIKGKELRFFTQIIESESIDGLLDIMKYWDFAELQKGIDQCYFMLGKDEEIDLLLMSLPNEERESFFSATLALHSRLRMFEASDSFTDAYRTHLNVSDLARKSRELFSAFLLLYDAETYEPLLKNELSRRVIQHILGAECKLSASDLGTQLRSLVGK